MPDPAELAPLRTVLATHGLVAKKSLGQNFLTDPHLTDKIAEAASAEGAVVYEVGPGPGGLTRALLRQNAAKVVAVERDERCLAALADLSAAFPGRLTVISGDAKTIDEAALAVEHGQAGAPFRIAANLPYNIATGLLLKWLTGPWPPPWASLTLMFQREVAERIVAGPDTNGYGRLSVLAGWRAKGKILFDVAPGAFVPAPKVTSSVIRLEPLPVPVAPAALSDLEKVTAAAFGHRRKMLRQSLKGLGVDTATLLGETGIAPTRRAETLSIAEFAALARTFAQMR
jgi:16S rRNA (adenine1518-N6/adenine1519-N6)-dimethyltransferase